MRQAKHSERYIPTHSSREDAKDFLRLVQSHAVMIPPGIKTVLAEGLPIVITSEDRLCTTKEAAEILQISRGHLIKMLESRKIPSYKVGTHRRIRAIDVFKYKDELDAQREEMLREMTAISQEAEGDE
jgi:excisionase family DNA binding protein